MPYPQHISEHVLKPLGTSSTTLQSAEVRPARLVLARLTVEKEGTRELPGCLGHMSQCSARFYRSAAGPLAATMLESLTRSTPN